MKLIVQKVSQAEVHVDNCLQGRIQKGFMVLLGLHRDDTHEHSDYMIKKLLNLRVFPDQDGKMNKSLLDVSGELLIVSQFTLYGNCQKGNRPSFIDAMPPVEAEKFYNQFIEKLEQVYGKEVQTGQFQAHMQVSLVNDGPVTIVLER